MEFPTFFEYPRDLVYGMAIFQQWTFFVKNIGSTQLTVFLILKKSQAY